MPSLEQYRSSSILRRATRVYVSRSPKLKQTEARDHKLQSRFQDVVSQHSRRPQNGLNFELIEQLKPRRGGTSGSGGNLTPQATTATRAAAASLRPATARAATWLGQTKQRGVRTARPQCRRRCEETRQLAVTRLGVAAGTGDDAV